LPEGRGITGGEIVARLREAESIRITESTLRRHVMPALAKSCGVKNHRSKGGYFIAGQPGAAECAPAPPHRV
jgi:hypothetical protein